MLNTFFQSMSSQAVAEAFKALADETRVSLLRQLAKGEQNVTTLCTELQMVQPTVSHHLGLLRMLGFARNRRIGKQVFYSLDRTHPLVECLFGPGQEMNSPAENADEVTRQAA